MATDVQRMETLGTKEREVSHQTYVPQEGDTTNQIQDQQKCRMKCDWLIWSMDASIPTYSRRNNKSTNGNGGGTHGKAREC